MAATLKVTHKAVGAEVRRDPYDILVDGERAGTVGMNDTTEIPVEPGQHFVQVRDRRKSSPPRRSSPPRGRRSCSVARRKRFLPLFLASCIFPKLALKLVRE